MGQHQLIECDSCGNRISINGFDARRKFQFPYETETEGEYHVEAYDLCNECVRKIADWIDDADESETRIEPVSVEQLADGLTREAEELADLAERLKDLTDGSEL